MGFSQIRRLGTDEASYAPERDLVWLFPRLMGIAQQSLRAAHLEPWLAQLAHEHGIGEKELAESFHRFATASAEIPRLVHDHPSSSLDACNFFASPPMAKTIVYARLGMAALCAYHRYLRESYASPVDAARHAQVLAQVERDAAEFLRDAKERDR